MIISDRTACEVPHAGSARLRHMAQLDSLRGLAIIAVPVYHAFLPPFLLLLALWTGNPTAIPGLGFKLLMLLWIFAVPVLSRYGIESQFNRLRSQLRVLVSKPDIVVTPVVEGPDVSHLERRMP